jgi:hypothetical protein
MSVDKGLPSGIRSPDQSGSIEPNDLPYFGLSRFDTRNSQTSTVIKTVRYTKSPMIQIES